MCSGILFKVNNKNTLIIRCMCLKVNKKTENYRWNFIRDRLNDLERLSFCSLISIPLKSSDKLWFSRNTRAKINLLKVDNRKTRKRCEMC